MASGDAVFIRTGRWARRAAVGLWEVNNQRAGLDPSVIPWLRERDVAILGSDAMHDAMPLQDGAEIQSPFAVHDFALIMLGVHLFDNVNLEAVGETAAELERWEFLLTAAPLRFRTATGSPLNPDCGVLAELRRRPPRHTISRAGDHSYGTAPVAPGWRRSRRRRSRP